MQINYTAEIYTFKEKKIYPKSGSAEIEQYNIIICIGSAKTNYSIPIRQSNQSHQQKCGNTTKRKLKNNQNFANIYKNSLRNTFH